MRIAPTFLLAMAAVSAAAHPLGVRDGHTLVRISAQVLRRDALPMTGSPAPPQQPQPAQPQQPQLEQPAQPAQPVQPVQPAQPAQPVQPAQSVQTAQPAQSVQQARPAQPQQNGNGDARPDHPQGNGNANQGTSGQQEHGHFEQVDHPEGNPNSLEKTTVDVVNDDRNGVHSNVVQHVAISNNNINGQQNTNVANGANGAEVNGQGNKMAAPDGSVVEQRPNGSVAITH